MTNAIEVTKRVMYSWLAQVKMLDQGGAYQLNAATLLENAIETHLEVLRLDAMDTLGRLAAMTQERDEIQGRLHAIDHAYHESQKANGIAGDEIRRLQEHLMASKFIAGTSASDSKEKPTSEQPDAKALMIVLGALVDAQTIVCDWGISLIKAKKAMGLLRGKLGCVEVVAAQKAFERRPVEGGCVMVERKGCVICGDVDQSKCVACRIF